MPIRSEGIAHAKLTHDGETDAIGEGPFLVSMFAEPVRACLKTRRVNPFQVQGFTLLDGVEKIHGRALTVTHEQQSDGLIGHIFSSEETALVARELSLEPESGGVMFIARNPQSKKASAIHENISGGHKGCDRYRRGWFCLWG